MKYVYFCCCCCSCCCCVKNVKQCKIHIKCLPRLPTLRDDWSRLRYSSIKKHIQTHTLTAQHTAHNTFIVQFYIHSLSNILYVFFFYFLYSVSVYLLALTCCICCVYETLCFMQKHKQVQEIRRKEKAGTAK